MIIFYMNNQEEIDPQNTPDIIISNLCNYWDKFIKFFNDAMAQPML